MDIDSHSWVLWVGVIAVALHVIEEYSEGWVTWANFEFGARFGIDITEKDFFLGSTGLIFIALAGAAIGWWAPAISLAVPALFVLNAVFSHMIPSARGDRLTPGTLSAVFIYLPVAVWMFWAASEDGQLPFETFLGAFIIGAAIMVFPLVALVLRERIGWDETTVAEATAEREAEATRKEEQARMRAEQELRAATPPVDDPDAPPAPEDGAPLTAGEPDAPLAEEAPLPEPAGETPGELEEDLVEDLDETPDEPADEPSTEEQPSIDVAEDDPGDDDTQVMPRSQD